MTAALIGSRLAAAYPDARCDLDHRSPFVNPVTPELFARYPDAEHLAEAEQDDVADIISSLGLYRSKARSLTGLARALVADHDGRVPESLDELVKLPGVGRKTANVVLGDAFGIPGITPDTHVIRVSNRFGWVHSVKPDDVERAVGALFPPGEWVVLCHRIIWHGRRCCRARTPACTACPVEDLCPSSQA